MVRSQLHPGLSSAERTPYLSAKIEKFVLQSTVPGPVALA